MTRWLVMRLLEDVTLGVPGWEFRVGEMGDGSYFQVRIPEAGAYAGCRKWYVSPHATVSEVVQTAFLAVRVAQEHELREQFKFRGKAILGPHFDVAALAEMSIPHDLRPLPGDHGAGTTNPGCEGSTPSAGTRFCECGHSKFVHGDDGGCIAVLDDTGELGMPPVWCACEEFKDA